MAIMIHPIHRRLAELAFLAQQKGGFDKLTTIDKLDLYHSLQQNATLVHQIDCYKEGAYTAQCNDQMDLVAHFVEKLDDLEARFT